jgi:hypothetical protein
MVSAFFMDSLDHPMIIIFGPILLNWRAAHNQKNEAESFRSLARNYIKKALKSKSDIHHGE